MATMAAVRQEYVFQTIVEEMANGVDVAVECWLSEIDQVIQDTRLTTLGKMNAIEDILSKYKRLTGKQHLVGRRA
jgi:hypothetical protein